MANGEWRVASDEWRVAKEVRPLKLSTRSLHRMAHIISQEIRTAVKTIGPFDATAVIDASLFKELYIQQRRANTLSDDGCEIDRCSIAVVEA